MLFYCRVIAFWHHVSSLFKTCHKKKFPVINFKPLKLVKLPPFNPAVIPLLAIEFPLPAQPSSLTTSDGQIRPSLPSSHPSPLPAVNSPILAVKFASTRPAVILHPFWQASSPLPFWRSFSTPSGGQFRQSPSGNHPPPLLAIILHPF